MKIKKSEIYEMYSKGISVKILARKLNKSTSTIYKYIHEMQDQLRYPQLKQEIKQILLAGDFKNYILTLDYSAICILKRKFHLYGNTKNQKIESILAYFKTYSLLGIYPEHLNKAIVKKAYFVKAKKVHPDLTKKDTNKEFIELNQAYNEIIQVIA